MMRVGTARVRHAIGMLTVNYCTCLLLAFLYTEGSAILPTEASLAQTTLLGGVNGVLYLVSFLAFQYNVKKNGVVLSSVFMKLGMLVPLLLSVLCFGEEPTVLQIFGFSMAVAAIVLINYRPGEGGKLGGLDLIVLLLLGGGAEGMSKVFEEIGNSACSAQFLFYTFAAALLLCIGYMLVRRQRIGMKEIVYGVLIGIPNFFSAKFVLRALADIPAMIVYPTFSVSTILAVSLVGVAIFGERLHKLQWVAVAAILVTLVALNI